jgi:hypothetical protein
VLELGTPRVASAAAANSKVSTLGLVANVSLGADPGPPCDLKLNRRVGDIRGEGSEVDGCAARAAAT